MKLLKAVQVHRAVCETMEREVGFSFAHALCLAKAALDPHVQFFAEKEMELIQKYAEKTETGGVVDQAGRFKLKPDQADAFLKDKAELDGVDIEVEKVKVSTAPERITGKALELLMEVMDFQDEREGEET